MAVASQARGNAATREASGATSVRLLAHAPIVVRFHQQRWHPYLGAIAIDRDKGR